MPSTFEFDMAIHCNKRTGTPHTTVRGPFGEDCPRRAVTNEYRHERPGPFRSIESLWMRDWNTIKFDEPGLPWVKRASEYRVRNAQSLKDPNYFSALERNMPEGVRIAAPGWSPQPGWSAAGLLPNRPGAIAESLLGPGTRPVTSLEKSRNLRLWNPQPATLMAPKRSVNPADPHTDA